MATMTYGSYNFDPVPLISYSVARVVDAADNRLYDQVTINCAGALVTTPGPGPAPINFGRLDDGFFAPLVSGIANDFEELIITHESGVFVSGVFPRIEGFATEEDVWVNKIRYNFAFVYEENINVAISGIESYSDTWDWAEEETDTATLSHNVNAVGLNTNRGGISNAFNNAKVFVSGLLGGENPVAKIPGGMPGQIFKDYNSLSYLRGTISESVDVNGGSYTVVENYILASGALLNSLHRNTFDISESSEGVSTVNVNGNIRGHGSTALQRNNRATFAWLNEVRPALHVSASDFHTVMQRTRILGSGFLSESVTRDHNAGTITYNASFSDLINDVNAVGIIDASFKTTEKLPIDLIASIPIPGKATGPVWQNLGTTTQGTYTLSGQVVGENLLKAKAYAQHLINTHGGQAKGNQNRITDMSIDPDDNNNSISFSVTWTYTGDGATPTIP
jgi:hypothetical protein